MGKRSAIALFLLLWIVPGAFAQEPPDSDQEARSLFEAGTAAFNAGRYAEALERFERSYELSGRPELIYNIAAAHDRLRNDAEALEAFERFLEEMPETPRRSEVESRIEVLRAQLARAAPSPEETARAAEPGPEPSLPDREVDDEGGSSWWIWVGAGALVIGAAVVTLVLLVGGGTEEPIPGDDGVVWTTLRGPP